MDLQDVWGIVSTAGFEEPDEGLDHERRAPDARARARGRRRVAAHQLCYLPRCAHLPRPATAQKLHRQVWQRRTPGTLRPAPRSAPARAPHGARGAGRASCRSASGSGTAAPRPGPAAAACCCSGESGGGTCAVRALSAARARWQGCRGA